MIAEKVAEEVAKVWCCGSSMYRMLLTTPFQAKIQMLKDITDDLLQIEEKAHIAQKKTLNSLANGTMSFMEANQHLHNDSVTYKMGRVVYLCSITSNAGIKSDAGKSVKEAVLQGLSFQEFREMVDKEAVPAEDKTNSEGA